MRAWNSYVVRMSGVRSRLADERTDEIGLRDDHSYRIAWLNKADIRFLTLV